MGRHCSSLEMMSAAAGQILRLLLLFSICFACMRTSAVHAAEVRVGNGVDFAAAVAKAAAGDRIIVPNGVHTAIDVKIDKPLEITGQAGATLDGKGKSQILIISAGNVVIRGLTFIRSGMSYVSDNAAIKATGISDLKIENCSFRDNFFGIYLAKSSNCIVRNCSFKASGRLESSSGNGIHQWYCRNSVIENNTIAGHRDGIYLEFSRNAIIRGNKSLNNIRYGLHFMFSDSCAYRDNLFQENGAGVAVMYSKFITMTGNIFRQNWGPAAYGLLLKEIADSHIERNRIEGNTTGLYADGCNRNTIHFNTFHRNGWGVKIYANSSQNNFKDNNFLSNTFAVSTNSSSLQTNVFDANYWSEYTGYDLNRDGFGDAAHHPVRLFTILIERQPTSLILLRSLFIDLLDAAERALPVLTPQTLADAHPRMKPKQ
ncbi:MAG: nitrous oxide reductase family maturation protein NosD [Bacteroidetes bacterium]|nr:nitrous oxide reductase family maturation protein NosD [Bacteroidota bacterium]